MGTTVRIRLPNVFVDRNVLAQVGASEEAKRRVEDTARGYVGLAPKPAVPPPPSVKPAFPAKALTREWTPGALE